MAVLDLLLWVEDSGYTVLEAANGADAIQVAEKYGEPIHLLLTDVLMPGMDGRKLAERVAQSYPGIKVLYMSGYTDRQPLSILRPACMLRFTPGTYSKKGNSTCAFIAETCCGTLESRSPAPGFFPCWTSSQNFRLGQ